MYNLGWSLFKFGMGFLVYTVFKTDWEYILIALIAGEIAFYIAYRQNWLFIKRYLFNIFYLFGYLTPLLFS